MNKSTLCTHLGCIISYDRNDSPGCISKGCAMTRAVPATMAEYKLPLPDGLQITDADRKAWGYDRCTSCGHKLYSGAHHSCPKPLRDALTKPQDITDDRSDDHGYMFVKEVKYPPLGIYAGSIDGLHIFLSGQKGGGGEAANLVRDNDYEQIDDLLGTVEGNFHWTDKTKTKAVFTPGTDKPTPNVNKSGPEGAKRPLKTAHQPLTVHYKSKIGISTRNKPPSFRDVIHHVYPDDATTTYWPNAKPPLTLWQISYRILAQLPLPGQPLYSNQYNLPL